MDVSLAGHAYASIVSQGPGCCHCHRYSYTPSIWVACITECFLYGELELQCHEENGANSRRAGESGPLAIVTLTPCCLGSMPCVIVSPRLYSQTRPLSPPPL